MTFELSLLVVAAIAVTTRAQYATRIERIVYRGVIMIIILNATNSSDRSVFHLSRMLLVLFINTLFSELWGFFQTFKEKMQYNHRVYTFLSSVVRLFVFVLIVLTFKCISMCVCIQVFACPVAGDALSGAAAHAPSLCMLMRAGEEKCVKIVN